MKAQNLVKYTELNASKNTNKYQKEEDQKLGLAR